jgi:hypothetical protein
MDSFVIDAKHGASQLAQVIRLCAPTLQELVLETVVGIDTLAAAAAILEAIAACPYLHHLRVPKTVLNHQVP